jgi:L-asparagine transporter-like permease
MKNSLIDSSSKITTSNVILLSTFVIVYIRMKASESPLTIMELVLVLIVIGYVVYRKIKKKDDSNKKDYKKL